MSVLEETVEVGKADEIDEADGSGPSSGQIIVFVQ